LNASSEEIRNESVWYLVHEFADDPQKIDERVLAAVDAPADERSLREAFGRELVRRMSGLERKDDPRWLKWLQSEEADALIGSEIAFLEYFTDPEFAARKNHCDIASYDCRTPASKPNRRVIPTTAVAPPAFLLPELLPAGLADAIAREGGCTSGWLGTGQASVDTAGRVREVALNPVDMSKNCERVVSALMRLSLASPDSIATPRETSNLLFVHAAGTPVCLDEPPITARPAVTHALGEGVQAPVIKRRVEPSFPANVRLSMGEGRSVLVIMQTTISREGCVRNIRLIRQSPFPELNGAAIVAVAQWRFEPGRMRGEPVDVLFNLTINFKTR
jgi:TonB family protein